MSRSNRDKQLLQDNYDRKNPSGKNAFCVSLGGSVSFPYTTKNMVPRQAINESSRYNYIWNKKLNQRLSLFAKLGLFSQQVVTTDKPSSSAEDIYLYTVTEEGKKYISRKLNMTSLCFGRRVIIDVLSDKLSKDRWGDDAISVEFSYRVEGIPDWAKELAVDKMFDFSGFGLNVNDGISRGSVYLRHTSNGLQITSGPSGMWLFL